MGSAKRFHISRNCWDAAASGDRLPPPDALESIFMCGLAGIFAYRDSASVIDRGELRQIRDHMAARGPDGSGEWFSPDGRVGLGHRRLSIIDLSARGAQPMQSADGRYVISFNGEIYNYRRLRAGLERRGRVFHSESDTEVLLHLYEEKGAAMLADLRGMFAFAIWDAAADRLFLARDPYGIKPLYYADDGATLRVASQVKALQAGGAVAGERDAAGLAGFLLFGSVPEPFTILRAVRAVPAGSWLVVDARGAGEPTRYFSVAATWRDAACSEQDVSETEAVVRIRDALRDTVAHHQVADVPVGAFLSAGIDSGALVGLMTEAGTPPDTVTVAFDEFRGKPEDEAPLAAAMAAHYGVRHRVYRVSEDEFRADWPAILAAMDQPSIDGVNTWFAAKAARAQGLKVAVSGLGGDELFGGYPGFRDIPRWVKWFGLPSRVPGFRRLAAGLGRSLTRVPPKAWGLLQYGGTFAGAWLVRRGLFMPWELPELMGAENAEDGLARLQPLSVIADAMRPDPENAFGRVAAMEASLYMRNQLLRDADWAGMAHSLEIRVPLVDSVLLNRAAPCVLKTQTAKQALASAPARPLPGEIRKRRKTGFTVPFQRWTQRIEGLEQWRRKPMLNNARCHWSRRFAYSVAAHAG